MAFKVFLSYSINPDEQVIVWRIQTLAAAQGIQVFVPRRGEFVPPSSRLGPLLEGEVRNAIDQSDCVLALITSGTGPAVEKELNYALAKNKLIIPIVEDGVADRTFLRRFNPIFRFSRTEANLGRVESEVSQFLASKKRDKDFLQGIGGLVAIGLGMLLLAGLSKE